MIWSIRGNACLLVLLGSLIAGLAVGDSKQNLQGRKMLDERVSILDGVLASPDLGPRPTITAPAPAPTVTSTATSSGSSGHHCGSGCIAGSAIGSIVGFALLVTAATYLYRRRGGACGCASSNPASDPLDHTYSISMEKKLPKRDFQEGDHVFCRCGGGCDFGTVASKGDGDEYYVKLVDGSAKTVDSSHLALNLSKGSPVLYTPPSGGETVKGTIVASDGSYWPPFYQLETENATKDAINTTAECLQAAKPTLGNPQ